MQPITILTYHSLDTSGSVVSMPPSSFADHMACLADLGYRGISLREAVAHREMPRAWPERSVVLTFDDGYANFREVACPTLLGHGFTATVFVVTAHMSGTNDWAPAPSGLGRRRLLSWQQAAELAAAGIEIGAHSRTHRNLRRLSEAEALAEIVESRADVQAHLGVTAESFAYPFGALSESTVAIVARHFRAACTTELRRAGEDPLHRLPRVDAYYFRGQPRRLGRVVLGQLDAYLAVRRLGRAVRAMVAAA